MSRVMTYSRLDKILRSLGFTVRTTKDPKAKIYEHATTGALLALPIFPDNKKVLPQHLAAVRMTLNNYGIANPTELVQQS